ncbi:MAG: vWA domain-containing protein [Myxococcota bacterium]
MHTGFRLLAAGLLALVGLLPLSGGARAEGRLSVEIHEPTAGRVVGPDQARLEVVGGASIYGGVSALDLFLVLDSSESLRRTDRDDHRTRGVVNLVRSLHPKANIHVGVVDFDRKATLLQPLTPDRSAVVAALETLDQKGETDLAAGIRAALSGFAERGRPGASKVALLFTDGKSDEKKALEAAREARAAGVAVHTLLLGDVDEGEALLRQIADGTDASFAAVTDPTRLADAFLTLRTTGVDRVSVRVGDQPPVTAHLVGGSFTAPVTLRPGRNRIEATATSLDGEIARTHVDVVLSGPLRVSIATPADGSEHPADEAPLLVQGSASTWDVALEEIGAEPADAGVREVWLQVDDGELLPTVLSGGRFEGHVPLGDGEHRLTAIATSVDGRTARDQVVVAARAPGCAELQIEAMRGEEPAISLSDRAIEIVFDASNSMWGRMQGEPKITVAQRTLSEALVALPDDVSLALRAYGHQRPHARRDCHDSQLLVPPTRAGGDAVRQAMAGLKPRGQTPIAYALRQIQADLGSFRGERAVVLVTDGIESCDGDPIAAARELQRTGTIPVHVIGFGLDGEGDVDLASLRAIAAATGGRFVTAGSAEELRDALATTVGTPFAVLQEGRTLATGTLGSPEPLRLPGGDYQLRIDSTPAYEVPISLDQEQGLTLMLKRVGAKVFHARRNSEIPYARCDLPEPEAPVPAGDGIDWQELPDAEAPAALPWSPGS